jgi:hypothetical protein
MHGCHTPSIQGKRAQCLASNECEETLARRMESLPLQLATGVSGR